ncbi:hypothetical protein BDZ97DRAFT_1907635 [Flammula alnicola]|nr:hypothetical protein BDZ97DRAFT_1907635 [Flammula alnicola]
MNFMAADVPDPTDFPPHAIAPGLRTLDGSFRCDICGDLYDAPVTIACGHCFCSTCIRASLALKQECPSCRKTTGEGHIRPNPALESVISAWKEARSYPREKERATSPSQTTKERPKSARECGANPGTDTFSGNVAGPSCHPRSSNGPNATTPKPPSRVKKLKPKCDDVIDMTIPSSDAEEDEITAWILQLSLRNSFSADDLVGCPLCQKKVRYRRLNVHMDNNCKDSGGSSDSAATSWSKIMGGGGKNSQHKGKHKKRTSDSDDEHPLPISSYTTLKDKQLKDMLAQQNLSLTGDRTNWEQRHRRYVGDAVQCQFGQSLPNRKTKAELKRDLKKWEEDMTKKKKPVITDVIGYQIEQKSEFARLVNQARQSKVKVSSGPNGDPRSKPGDTIVVDSEGEGVDDL